jgi:hypothetical protein
MSPSFFQLSPVVVVSMPKAIRMEMSAVQKFSSDSGKNTSVNAELTFTAAAVNQEIRQFVLDTINGATSNGGIKGRLRAAAKALGLPFGRVRRYHYGEVRRIEAHEAFQIVKRAELARRAEFARKQLELDAMRLAMANSAPSYLAFLVPPAVPPLLDHHYRDGVDPADPDPLPNLEGRNQDRDPMAAAPLPDVAGPPVAEDEPHG